MAHKLLVLGPPEFLDPFGSPVSVSFGKPLGLLVYVACSPAPVSRDDLVEVLWPGVDREKGRHSVRQALWILRNAIGQDFLESEDPVALKDEVIETDLRLFTEALSSGRITDAEALWRGPLMDQFVLAGVREWGRWKEEVRTDLERRFCRALLQHAESREGQEQPEQALAALERAIEVNPFTETPHLARVEVLLNLSRLDAAREAVADAERALGNDQREGDRMIALKERIDRAIQKRRARIKEADTFPLEFVGRSRELAALQNLWRKAEGGQTRVAVITGPSGIGKTRLAQELLSCLEPDKVGRVVIKGTRAEMKLRWGGAAEFVRHLLLLPGSAGISSASDSLLRAMLPSLGRGPINLQTVNGVSPVALLDAVSDLLKSVSFETPLAVLLDDLQWMDPDSRVLFFGLTRRQRDLPVLFLMLGRSDLSSRHWEEVESVLLEEAGAQHFVLGPLTQEEIGELLALGAAFSSPQDAERVVAQIHQASGGNPLFIREILEDLLDKEVLHQEAHGWVIHTSDLPERLDIPENIRALLHERMSRLSTSAIRVAATLAGEDRQMASESLRERSQLPPEIFTQALAELLERGVIEWVGGTSVDFVHDLLRDAAKANLAGLPSPPLVKSKWIGLFALA